jgi:hypothetical protein
MKKFLLALSLITFCIIILPQKIFAKEHNNIALEYSLDSYEKKQVLTYINENNNEVTITIEPIVSMLQISEGEYKVSKKVAGMWSVSYIVRIDSKENFISANNLSVKALTGSIQSSSLTYTSKKATCSFTQKIGLVTSNASVTATISNGKLTVK